MRFSSKTWSQSQPPELSHPSKDIEYNEALPIQSIQTYTCDDGEPAAGSGNEKDFQSSSLPVEAPSDGLEADVALMSEHENAGISVSTMFDWAPITAHEQLTRLWHLQPMVRELEDMPLWERLLSDYCESSAKLLFFSFVIFIKLTSG